MKIEQTSLPGLWVVESKKFEDARGSFMRLFCMDELSSILGDRQIVQVNRSVTVQKGSIRGLHYQTQPYAEMKLVRCLTGKVFDVAVDLRKGSKTFLQWHAEILTPENNKMMVIPEGFAHGFQTLENESEILYLHTQAYQAEFEGGVLFNDPELNIQWPLVKTNVSERDSKHPLIDDDFTGLDV